MGAVAIFLPYKLNKVTFLGSGLFIFIYLFKVVFLDHSQALLSKWDALREKKSSWSNKCGKSCLLNTSWRVTKHLTH